MLNILISFLTFVLILISLFMVLVILMQRGSSNAGMGSAFGGGAAESAFGAETTNVLTKATKWSAVSFFVIALALYLLYMSRESVPAEAGELDVPDIPVQTQETGAPQPAATTGTDHAAVAEDPASAGVPETPAAAEDDNAEGTSPERATPPEETEETPTPPAQ